MNPSLKFNLLLYARVLCVGVAVALMWFVFDHTFGEMISDRSHDYLLIFFAAQAGSWATLLTLLLPRSNPFISYH